MIDDESPRNRRRRKASSLLTLLALCSAACSRVYEYPNAESERSALFCTDGVDNDYDGDTDCDDTDCNGFCPETTPLTCSDGRDNDGDGLTDTSDPRCWPFQLPAAERCGAASGIDLFDGFDQPSVGYPVWERGDWPWLTFGDATSMTIVNLEPHFGGQRGDWLATFTDSTRANVGFVDSGSLRWLDSALGVLIRQVPFSGSFRDLELSFDAYLPEGALLRAAIAPVEAAPSGVAPLPGAENALVSVLVDTSQPSPELVLTVRGVPSRRSLPGGALFCTDTREECASRVTLSVDSQRFFRASLRDPSGLGTEVDPIAVPDPSLSASRLVFWGGTVDAGRSVGIDDVRLRAKPELPCGFSVPQIGETQCGAPEGLAGFGQHVALARSAQGKYCALLGASTATAGDDERPPPKLLTAWTSEDGESWTFQKELGLSDGDQESALLVGAGLASDAAGFHAAVLVRDERGNSELRFMDGASCDSLVTVAKGPLLFDDAEAPSYVISGAAHEIYFTRAPGEGPRTIFRILRDAPEATPEHLADLAPDVGAPVQVSLVGATDRVLVYPFAPESGRTGVGVSVLDEELAVTNASGDRPLLAVPPRPELPAGHGRIGFDDRGVLAAALSFAEDGGILLYTGQSTSGRIDSAREPPLLSVGTARLGGAVRGAPVTLESCGDGVCGAWEGCETCSDCACPGVDLLGDPFTDANTWSTSSAAPEPARIRYFDSTLPALHFVGGASTWSVLPLATPLPDAFELSFDLFFSFTMPKSQSCSVYVGLGAGAEAGAGSGPPASGLFVRAERRPSCADQYFVSGLIAAAGTGTEVFTPPVACAASDALPSDTWQRIVLRREGQRLTLTTVRPDGCGVAEQSSTYEEPLPELAALYVGFGGAPFENCLADVMYDDELEAGAGAIANLKLRALSGAGR